MRKILIFVSIIIISFFILSIAKDRIIKSVVSMAATEVTGAKVDISGFSLAIFKQSVRINRLKMYNPRGFSSSVLADLPKVVVDYDLPALLKGKLHLPRVEVELKEIILEKNGRGELNVDSLKVVRQHAPRAPKEKTAAKPLAMRVDLLNLQMGRIVYKDYSVGKEPIVEVYEINLKKTYKNITSAQQLVMLILAESMKHAGIEAAKIYGAAFLAGTGMIPMAIVSQFLGKDSAQQNFDVTIDKLFEVSLAVLKRIGKVNKEDRLQGIIEAKVREADITVKLKPVSAGTSHIIILARKHMLPKPEIAGGILYQISEQLK